MEKGSLRAFGRGLLTWLAAAATLSLMTAVLVRACEIPSARFGYFSSALSFVSALLAGLAAAGAGREQAQTLPGALGLCLVLLTLGCVVGRGMPEPSALLSVVSFSLAGWLLGGLLSQGKKIETKHSSFHTKKKQSRKG